MFSDAVFLKCGSSDGFACTDRERKQKRKEKARSCSAVQFILKCEMALLVVQRREERRLLSAFYFLERYIQDYTKQERREERREKRKKIEVGLSLK